MQQWTYSTVWQGWTMQEWAICCEVCLISRKDPRVALVPCGRDIGVSASRAPRRYISVGTDVQYAGLTLP